MTRRRWTRMYEVLLFLAILAVIVGGLAFASAVFGLGVLRISALVST